MIRGNCLQREYSGRVFQKFSSSKFDLSGHSEGSEVGEQGSEGSDLPHFFLTSDLCPLILDFPLKENLEVLELGCRNHGDTPSSSGGESRC